MSNLNKTIFIFLLIFFFGSMFSVGHAGTQATDLASTVKNPLASSAHLTASQSIPKDASPIQKHVEVTASSVKRGAKNERQSINKEVGSAKTDFNQVLNAIAPDKHSALEQRIKQENTVDNSLFGIIFDEPTYILPFYYSSNPNKNIGQTPDKQQVEKIALKAQLSLEFPVWKAIFGHKKWSLNASYTQLSYWQVYAKSQYFSETDYEPALYVSDDYLPNWLFSAGVVHQSNGRGGEYERSWNRAFLNMTFSGTQWLVSIKPWILIFKADSSDLHNSDIARYLGYERTVAAYKFGRQEVSIMLRNLLISGFQRGAEELDYSFPLHGHLMGYIQYFHGYGQSLIEYKTETNSVGIGIALSNWI